MPTVVWSLPWNAVPRGLALARESGHLLLWDDRYWLTLFDSTGQRQGQVHRTSRILSASIAEDGSAIGCVDQTGGIAWLRRDLSIRWEQTPDAKPLAIAMDIQGELLVYADASASVRVMDDAGIPRAQMKVARPLHHLALIPGQVEAVGSAEYGFVAKVDLTIGETRWRDVPVIHHGGIAVAGQAGAGSVQTIVACFSDGIRAYDRAGKSVNFPDRLPACRDVALSIDGQAMVLAGLDGDLHGFRAGSKPWFVHRPDAPPVAIALEGNGRRLYVALANQMIQCIDLSA